MYLLSLSSGGLNPSDADIVASPYLDGWSIESFAIPGDRVVGYCIGHPLLPDGMINTGTPVHADLDRRWLAAAPELATIRPSPRQTFIDQNATNVSPVDPRCGEVTAISIFAVQRQRCVVLVQQLHQRLAA